MNSLHTLSPTDGLDLKTLCRLQWSWNPSSQLEFGMHYIFTAVCTAQFVNQNKQMSFQKRKAVWKELDLLWALYSANFTPKATVAIVCAISQVKKTSLSVILLPWWGLICNQLYLQSWPLQLHQHLGLESWQECLGSAPGGSGNFITFSTHPACLRKTIYGREQN